jgi:hypothetical protein
MTALTALLTRTASGEIRVCDSCSITWHEPCSCWCCAGPGTVIHPESAPDGA